jgi:glyoxylase-like metal-dependent hydrolase (beta-lactamase superfamily II)
MIVPPPLLSRRALLAVSAVIPGLTAKNPGSQKQFRMDRVSDRCWAGIALPWATVPQCNSAIFVGDECAAVIDAQATVDCALALRRQIREEVTDQPIRYVFLTHHHLDHAHGAAAYRDATVVSSQATKELLRQEEPWLREYSAFRNPVVPANDRLSGYYEFLDSTLLGNGRELARKGNLPWVEYFEERRTVPLAAPALTFTGEFRVDPGRLELRASTLGPAHTVGDVIVYAPSERAVATGDLLNSFEPLLFEADIAH